MVNCVLHVKTQYLHQSYCVAYSEKQLESLTPTFLATQGFLWLTLVFPGFQARNFGWDR